MLVIQRRLGDGIVIDYYGTPIVITVTHINTYRGRKVRLGITAPREMPILRDELAARGNSRVDSNKGV